MTKKKTTTEAAPAAEEKSLEEIKSEQFPALEGREDVELAKRSADADGETAETFVKEFLVPTADWTGGDKTQIDTNNKLAVETYLTQQGVRLVGEVTRTGTRKHPDGVSTFLIYKAEARPAVVTPQHEVVVLDSDAKPAATADDVTETDDLDGDSGDGDEK